MRVQLYNRQRYTFRRVCIFGLVLLNQLACSCLAAGHVVVDHYLQKLFRLDLGPSRVISWVRLDEVGCIRTKKA
jgi:hypothetical protein